MQIRFQDFNGADKAIAEQYAGEWDDLEHAFLSLPLHLKASDQDGKVGAPIFDPVGSNSFIKEVLAGRGWASDIPIPSAYSFLGIHLDYGKGGVIGEAQFSNYPFLLNNLLRSELFYRAKLPLSGRATGLAVIITKAHMFPASNSTLYYEQALSQTEALARLQMIEIPVRVVGLFAPIEAPVAARWTDYHAKRYSRTVVATRDEQWVARPGRSCDSRCLFTRVGGA